MHTSVIFLSCACVPGLETGKNDTIPLAPVAPVAVTVNQWISLASPTKKITIFGGKSHHASAILEKEVPKNGILDAMANFFKKFKKSLRN